ncbi:hypothetical protein [Turneriella parva]|uniref:Uncharacterized protein n=1 Tax=Turneriella parva (strain ATCC BAA-1111 / DSM 21527 / NCTC 11395 / H) TaxID=869212 RepID=I4B9J0_TURPD|nr:hypothetical protein [Turneriella parva]AFM13947.1 hypothetical protein Turpa_3309 [Turneriella parva DSM 21527]
MNSILGSALIGGVAGFIGFFLASRILGTQRKKAAQIVGLILMSVFTALGNAFILPTFKGQDIKAQLKPYLEDEMTRPMVDAIREFDPPTYEAFLDEMTKIIQAYPNGPQEKVDLLGRSAGARLSAKYYRAASDDALLAHLSNTIRTIRKLSDVSPNNGVRLIFPETFGSVQYTSLPPEQKEIMKQFMSTVRELVRSSMVNPTNKEHSFGSYYLETYRTAYLRAHPELVRQFSNLNSLKTEPEQRDFLNNFSLFLEGMLKLPKKQAADMQRSMGSSQ